MFNNVLTDPNGNNHTWNPVQLIALSVTIVNNLQCKPP